MKIIKKYNHNRSFFNRMQYLLKGYKPTAVAVKEPTAKVIGDGITLLSIVDGKANIIDNGVERSLKINTNTKGDFVRIKNITHYI